MSEEAGTTPGVNLSDPAVQAAIQAARQDEKAQAARQYQAQIEEEVKGLKGKNKELLDKLDGAKKQNEALSTKIEAAEHGVDPDKLENLAQRKAAEKAELIRREMADEIKQAKDRAEKETELRTVAERKAHRARVEALMGRYKGILPSAFGILADSVEKLVAFQLIDGVEVPILQRNGETISGTVDDLLNLAREGKPPIPDRTFCFESVGQGSGTTSANGKPGSSNWWKMTQTEQTEYVEKHGSDAAMVLIDKSGPKPRPSA